MAEGKGMSDRQQEVLDLVAQGLTNQEAAERLYISENTVKYHMKNILGKLQMKNRFQVIAWAATQRFLRYGECSGVDPGPGIPPCQFCREDAR